MGIPQYTTPTFTLTFENLPIDLTQMHGVFVTFRAPGGLITKTGDDLTVTENTITVSLNQAETATLRVGAVEIQANWTDGTNRVASEIATVEMSEQLLKRVIE